jgi:hypothetical protein
MSRFRAFRITAIATLLAAGCLKANPNRGDDGDDGTDSSSDGSSEDGSGSGEETGADPTCDDEEHNGDETDVDCGGGCMPCPDHDMCQDAEDCQSMNCDLDDLTCTPAACDDAIHNGGEAMADCGGPCPVCILEELRPDWAAADEGDETQPAIDLASDGTLALAWIDAQSDVQFRWFHPDGTPTDGYLASGNTADAESAPVVRIRETDGLEMIVAYLDPENMDSVVEFRGFDPTGAQTSAPVVVGDDPAQDVEEFTFDLHGDDVLFAWRVGGYRILARRYDLATDMFLEIADLEVAMADATGAVAAAYEAAGGFGLTWTHDLGNFDFECYARIRTAQGVWTGAPAAVNEYTMGTQLDPHVATLPGGGFVVVWSGATQADPSDGLAARILDADGMPNGGEIQLNDVPGALSLPSVATLRDGFVVAWLDVPADTVRLRRFDLAGDPRTEDDEEPWGATQNLQSRRPALATDDEQIVLLWSAQSEGDLDVLGVRLAY